MANSLILEIPVIPEKRAEFIQVMQGALPVSRAYDGCISIELWTLEGNDGAIQLYETWESKAHQEKYFAWRVETGFLDAIGPFLAGAPTVTWLEVHSK